MLHGNMQVPETLELHSYSNTDFHGLFFTQVGSGWRCPPTQQLLTTLNGCICLQLYIEDGKSPCVKVGDTMMKPGAAEVLAGYTSGKWKSSLRTYLSEKSVCMGKAMEFYGI
jgi:hypothetical protein